jgi:hypothetical protein
MMELVERSCKNGSGTVSNTPKIKESMPNIITRLIRKQKGRKDPHHWIL